MMIHAHYFLLQPESPLVKTEPANKADGKKVAMLISKRLVYCIARPSRSAIRGGRTGLADSVTISPMLAVCAADAVSEVLNATYVLQFA